MDGGRLVLASGQIGEMQMSKSVITRLFVGGIVAVIAGIVLAATAFLWAYAAGAFVMNGPDVVAINGTGFTAGLIAAGIIAVLAIVGGAIAGLVSWIGALINTAALQDKAWFIVLLVLGLLSFGFIAMIAYVIAGPDSTRLQPHRPAQPANVAAGA
jgi:hypothetical protein